MNYFKKIIVFTLAFVVVFAINTEKVSAYLALGEGIEVTPNSITYKWRQSLLYGGDTVNYYYSTVHSTCGVDFWDNFITQGWTAAGSASYPYDGFFSGIHHEWTFSGLSPNTEYYLCLYGVAQSDPTIKSSLSSAAIKTGFVPIVTTNPATNITDTSGTLNGSADPEGGTGTGWFRLSTTNPGSCNDTFGIKFSDISLGSGSSPIGYYTPLEGFLPGTTYYYCAIASNEAGKGYGALSSFKTLAGGGIAISASISSGSVNWRITGPTTQTGYSNTTLSSMSAGTYTITWCPLGQVSGYLCPSPLTESKTLTSGGTINFYGDYTRQTGTVKISPSISEAFWQLDPHYKSGSVMGCESRSGNASTTLTSMPTGYCNVTWSPIFGYDTPSSVNKEQLLTNGGTITFTGNYTRQYGTVVADPNIAAPWTLSGCKSQTGTGDLSISSVPVDFCTITWGAVAGYDTPSPETKLLTKNGTANFIGNYTQQTGTVYVSPSISSAPWTLSNCKSQIGTGSVTITSVPAGTCTITWGSVSGYTTPDSQSLTLTSSGTITFSGTYTLNSYTVSATAGSGGSISPSSRTVSSGNTTTFTVTPNSGYTASASGCGGSLSGTTYTTGAITANCTVTATFTTTPLPDLTAGSITPTSATAETAKTFLATISNTGVASTGVSFTNLFQFDSNADHAAVDDTRTATAGPIATGSSASASASYAFPSSGTWYVRACADNNASWVSTITESDEGNNCGAWTSVTVVSACSPLQGTGCFKQNACDVNWGTYQCDGISCSALDPDPLPANYGNSCTSSANSCGNTNTGTIQCDNTTCNATIPPESTCSSCGDGTCNGTESLLTCPQDCRGTVRQF